MDKYTLIIIAVIVIAMALIVYLIIKLKNNKAEIVSNVQSDKETEDAYIEDCIAQYGQPEDIITTSSIVSTAPSKPVLVYPNFLLINGLNIEKKAITDVTFNNSANPYVNNDYQIVILTSLPDHAEINITIGNDLEMARKTAEEIRASLVS